jgi:enamine deaminase RidA (YjgF/YER057c/UK114 family)
LTETPKAALFPSVVQAGRTVYIGCRFIDDGGDIERQTAAVFESLVGELEAAGATMADLVNLRTYYVYQGPDGPAVTQYWNEMTAVRLRYIADPGPAATALRVQGVPDAANLIGVDGIATLDADRQRIMPEHSWDWTIPTPLSQGWRIGDKVFVGGQLAADRSGKALAESDVAAQTAITLDYIRHVLAAGDHSWGNVVAMRICFKHDGIGGLRLAEILRAVRQALPEPRPAITAIGVDLLYEGLLLEIDAVSRRADKQAVVPSAANAWIGFDGFPLAMRCGDELHIGGLSAPGGASLQAQVEATFQRLLDVIDASGFGRDTVVKITMFQVSKSRSPTERAMIMDLARRYLPIPGPVVTLVSVPSLPHGGQLFQIDGVAVLRFDG